VNTDSDGVLDDDLARRRRLSEHVVLEICRLHGNVQHVGGRPPLAVFERNGNITVGPETRLNLSIAMMFLSQR